MIHITAPDSVVCNICHLRNETSSLHQAADVQDLQPIAQHITLPPEILSLIASFIIPNYDITATLLDGHGIWDSRVHVKGLPEIGNFARVCQSFRRGIAEGLRAKFSGKLEVVNYCNREKWNFVSNFVRQNGLEWMAERVTWLKVDGILSTSDPKFDLTVFPSLRDVEVHMRGPIGWDVINSTESLTMCYPRAVLYRDGYLSPELMREGRQLKRSLQPSADTSERCDLLPLDSLLLVRHYVMPLTSWNESPLRQVSIHWIDLSGDDVILIRSQRKVIEHKGCNFEEYSLKDAQLQL